MPRLSFSFLLVLILIVFNSCTNEKQAESSATEKQILEKDTFHTDSIKLEQPILEKEDIENFADSLNSYFKKIVGFKIKKDTIHYDTLITSRGIKYVYVFATNKHLHRFRIDRFEFFNLDSAQYYYDSLLTMEYAAPFGLNKSPNHIFIDSNRVFRFYYNHTWGHRMKDVNEIFYSQTGYRPKSLNLDSVSGFNYCQCNKPITNPKRIEGIWISVDQKFIQNPAPKHVGIADENGERPDYSCHLFDSLNTPLKFKIDKMKFYLNGEIVDSISLRKREFPNYVLYKTISWLYDYYYYDVDDTDFLKQKKNLLQKNKNQTGHVTVYYIDIANTWCSIELEVLENGRAYVQINDQYFQLKKSR